MLSRPGRPLQQPGNLNPEATTDSEGGNGLSGLSARWAADCWRSRENEAVATEARVECEPDGGPVHYLH